MKSIVILVLTMLALVAAKPIEIDEENADFAAATAAAPNGLHFGDRIIDNGPTTPRDAANEFSLSYVENNYPDKPQQDDPSLPDTKVKRSVESEFDVNKHFFDSIYDSFTRNIRRAQGAPTQTIALGDLLSAVERTLVHSAQNLANANATNTTSFNSGETSTVIALPITLPTPAPIVINNEEEPEATTTETPLVREDRSSDDILPTGEIETVSPVFGNEQLGLLKGITFAAPHPDAENILQEHIEATENDREIITTTVETPVDNTNVTIIQTINSTQVVPTDSGTHVQQQQITLFSAAAGIFPSIPSVLVQHYNTENNPNAADSAQSSSSSSSSEEEVKVKEGNKDCSSSETSGETTSEHNEKCSEKLENPLAGSSPSTSTTTTSTSPSSTTTTISTSSSTTTSTTTETAAKKAKKAEILKEKIAEVEADPVILTQGI